VLSALELVAVLEATEDTAPVLRKGVRLAEAALAVFVVTAWVSHSGSTAGAMGPSFTVSPTFTRTP
jgi:hypothetical protein